MTCCRERLTGVHLHLFLLLIYCVCLMPGSKPNFLQHNFFFLSNTPPPQPPLFPYFSISSKYRQRRLIPHLSVSHSHTNSQVYMQVLCGTLLVQAREKKKKKKEHICESLSKQNTDSEQKTQPWTRKSVSS